MSHTYFDAMLGSHFTWQQQSILLLLTFQNSYNIASSSLNNDHHHRASRGQHHTFSWSYLWPNPASRSLQASQLVSWTVLEPTQRIAFPTICVNHELHSLSRRRIQSLRCPLRNMVCSSPHQRYADNHWIATNASLDKPIEEPFRSWSRLDIQRFCISLLLRWDIWRSVAFSMPPLHFLPFDFLNITFNIFKVNTDSELNL